MSGKSEDDINQALAETFRQVGAEAAGAIRQLTIGMHAGRSFREYRTGNYAEAVASLAGFTQTERDALHSWARWLIGNDPL